jgi:hypothetical protein
MLAARKRPTLLVIFGDHLPSLMQNYGMFVDRMVHSRDQRDWSVEEWKRMYSTPLIMWSNFNFPNEDRPIEVSLLGARILRNLGLASTPYQNFLAQLSDKVRVINPNMPIDIDPQYKPMITDYKIFQYGILSGEILKPTPNLQASRQRRVATDPAL